jgi:PAS domain S-box-containing protein
LGALAGPCCRCDWEPDFETALARLAANDCDVCLLSHRLGERRGLDLLRAAVERGCTVPIILLNDHADAEQDQAAIRAGAADYLLRADLTAPLLGRTIRHARERQRLEAQREQQNRILEMIATGQPVSEVLDTIALFVERECPGRRCSILLAEGCRLWHGAAPSLPEVYVRAIQGAPFGADVGSCGTAAFTRVPVDVEDISTDPRWTDYRAVALPHELRSCYSAPIIASDGLVLGTFGIYGRQVGKITDLELDVVRRVIHLTGIALARHRSERAARASEAELREKITILHAVTEGTTDAVFVKDREGIYLLINTAGAALLGTTPEAVVGKHDRDLFSPDTVEQVLRSDRIVLATGRTDTFEEHATAASVTRTYLATKGPLRDESGQVIGVIGISRDITERKRAEEALHLRNRVVEAFSEGIIITDPHQPGHPIIYVNAAFEALTGYPAAEVLGRNCRFLQGRDSDPAAVDEIRTAIRDARPVETDVLNYRKDGTPFWNRLSVSPIFDRDGALTHFVGFQADVTEQRSLAEQLQQSQRLEAIGRLAGGVAHDFNNMLAVINGYSELLQEMIEPESPLRSGLQEITKAGKRAAALTRQLLAFSRKQVLEPRVLDLRAVVSDMEKMLRRVIGEDVELVIRVGDAVGRVLADPGQMEQVLLNLAVNSRDAMPRGGTLRLEVDEVRLDEGFRRLHPDVSPGCYVRLTVADSGVGIPEEIQPHVFEPFYTTKEPGKGTGLGLATVFGIIKQSEGHITLDSVEGGGATFRVYLPRVQEVVVPETRAPERRLAGSETVLLVEDETMLRELLCHALRAQGYAVLPAANGENAVRIASQYDGVIHLLLTDVVMPGGMSGRQVAERMAELRPAAKVLYMSGYTDDAVLRHGVADSEVEFIHKPFTPGTLLERIRQLLDR